MKKFYPSLILCLLAAVNVTFGQSPGGVTNNNRLWLKANTGVSSLLSTVTGWNDQSGGGNNANTINGTGTTFTSSAINSYPIVNFGGSGGLQGTFGTTIAANTISAFIVTNMSSSTSNTSGLFCLSSSGSVDTSATTRAALFERSVGGISSIRNGNIKGTYTNANAVGNYHIFSTHFSATQDSFFAEGANATRGAYTAAALSAGIYTVGSRYTGSSSIYMTGQIAEVILYDRSLTAAERNRVESYLAVKYGLSLSQTSAQNYVSSTGTVVWSAASNGSYKNNIFGVAIDNASALSQTASVSINTNLLKINSASGLTSGSYLLLSDNGGSNSLTTVSGLPNAINTRLSIAWRASQTGTRGSASFVYDISSTAFGYYATIASSMTPYMLIDSNADGIYETYLSPSSTSGSLLTFTTSLRDGALFTFGYKASIDYGDAPGVPTLVANNGAGHVITAGVYLGSQIDAEIDGQPSLNSVGDDTIGLADEDGVNFNIGVPTNGANIVQVGQNNTITVVASTSGYLNAWIDLNQDNAYGTSGSEYVIQNQLLSTGTNTLTFFISDSVQYGATSMRFRFAKNSIDVTGPTGLAANGEVEDYKIYITAPLVGPCTNGFQNPSFESGPAPSGYLITSETNLPYWRTTATDKMIEVWKSGYQGVPAYDGSYFVELEANLTGALYQDVYTTPGTTLLWNFAHRGRSGRDTCNLKIGPPGSTTQVTKVIDNNTAWGVYQGGYIVPANQYVTRFEFNALGSFGGNNSIGNFLDDVYVSNSFDYGDAPDSYGTLYASNAPYHALNGTLYLGAGASCESDGKPSSSATLDSLDDGVTFPTACSNCNTYTVNISVYNNTGSRATIAGWIDFNKNGVFDSIERASISVPSSALSQSVTMTFTVTSFSSASTTTYARFRVAIDSTQITTPYGLATTGEVEDYQVPCVGLPIPIPTSSGSPACTRGPLNLYASGLAPAYSWSGPNSFHSSLQNPLIAAMPQADSGWYRVYAIYANGCVRDSATYIATKSCYVTMSGAIFDDANGNGLIDGTDTKTTHGEAIYAVLKDNSNNVLATSPIAANGTFTFAAAPAYMSGMYLIPVDSSAPPIGTLAPASSWPSTWVGTKGQYGTNNIAGSGIYGSPSLLPVSTGSSAVSNELLGYDRLPVSNSQTYLIPYPSIGAIKHLTPANHLGYLSGSDQEDGTLTSGSTFTITSLAGMNGNELYYDANGDGILQPYEQILGYTTITKYDSTRLFIKFVGSGSINLSFTYGSTDAAAQIDPNPSTYTINWVGTLPVRLLYFSAEQMSEQQSMLSWATETEIDNAYFEVQRSVDALYWQPIAQVPGAGNSSTYQEYSFIDPSPTLGVNYYRLRQVDIDGNDSYSDIAEVSFGVPVGSAILLAHPNPFLNGGLLYIHLSNATDLITHISLSNAMGQIVYATDIDPTPISILYDLHASPGLYLVSVTTADHKILTKHLIIDGE